MTQPSLPPPSFTEPLNCNNGTKWRQNIHYILHLTGAVYALTNTLTHINTQTHSLATHSLTIYTLHSCFNCKMEYKESKMSVFFLFCILLFVTRCLSSWFSYCCFSVIGCLWLGVGRKGGSGCSNVCMCLWEFLCVSC